MTLFLRTHTIGLCLAFLIGVTSAQAASRAEVAPQAQAAGKAQASSEAQAAGTVQTTPTPPTVAPQPVAPSAFKQLESYRQRIKTMSGNFSQNNPQLGKSSGHFVFSQDGFFRWDVLQPHAQSIMVYQGRIYQYDADLSQLSIQKEQFAKGTQPLQIVFGNTPLSKYFTSTDLGESNGYNWVQLVPKGNDLGVKMLKIGLKLGIPFVVELTDFFGNVSTIQFSNLRPNAPITPADQRLDVPKGTSVLNLGT